MFQKLGGVIAGRLQLNQRLQPLVGGLLQLVNAVLVLVQPVRGDSGFGEMMHARGPDLHLDRGTEGANQRGV